MWPTYPEKSFGKNNTWKSTNECVAGIALLVPIFLEISCFKGKNGAWVEWKLSGNFCSVWHLAPGALGNCCGTSLQVTGSWNKDSGASSLWELLELSNPVGKRVPGSPVGSDHLNVPWICSLAPLLVRSMGSRTNWDLKQLSTAGVEGADFAHSWVVSSSWSCFLYVPHLLKFRVGKLLLLGLFPAEHLLFCG